MAGIKVPQHKIFKIHTDKLKYGKWDIKISKKDALKYEELVPLFQAQIFRSIAKILNKNTDEIDYTKYILALETNPKKKDFDYAVKNGFKVNNVKFVRFVGTTGGLKSNTVLFVNEDIYDELYEVSECGRDISIPMIPAKIEAYRALFCSASQPIAEPNGILVVSDCITKYYDTIINIDDSNTVNNDKAMPEISIIENAELYNTVSDGFNLCTIEYMDKIRDSLEIEETPSGVCLRNAWLKGMLFPFPIIEFFDKYMNGNYIVKDIWGNDIDIRNIDVILTESSLKMWKAYKSIEDYVDKYRKYGYTFSTTKIASNHLEDEREVNYQYLQSYEFDDEDIKKLCNPTINYLKNSMCGDYKSTIKFLGIDGQLNDNSWQQALSKSSYFMKDPYIIDSVHRLLKKKIDEAKIGKLKIEGNYQIACGDAFALMQHICGLEVTGILKENEIYSKYWVDKNVNEVCAYRSPMTSHNNIRKCIVNNNEEVKYWFQYMKSIIVINGLDSFMMAENGQDADGDANYTTNNEVLLNKFRKLLPINCVQKTSKKVIIDKSAEDLIVQSNKNGMGNKVGQITNRITNMMDLLAKFEKDSKEYKELSNRILCGQLFQQNELDKIKGIEFIPMPKHWYSYSNCDNDFDRSICAENKPYFFLYNYEKTKKDYNKYMKSNESKCIIKFGITLKELIELKNKTKEQQTFLDIYNKFLPIGKNNCAMNRICWYIEEQMNGYKSGLKVNGTFDYTKLKYPRIKCKESNREKIKKICDEYVEKVKEHKKIVDDAIKCKSNYMELNNSENGNNFRVLMRNEFLRKVKKACPRDEERLNIVLDLCYGCRNNKQFCWDVVGDLIIKRLDEVDLNEN